MEWFNLARLMATAGTLQGPESGSGENPGGYRHKESREAVVMPLRAAPGSTENEVASSPEVIDGRFIRKARSKEFRNRLAPDRSLSCLPNFLPSSFPCHDSLGRIQRWDFHGRKRATTNGNMECVTRI
jgi:hypothetical protein